MPITLNEILKLAVERGASDVHLKAGIIPVIRKQGELRPLSSEAPALTGKELEDMAFAIMDARQKQIFTENMDVDISYGLTGVGRFRINVLKQRGTIRMVIRNIPDKVRSIDELLLPDVIKKIASQERGLVLVTGATGSGKSSTLAAIIDHINRNRSRHILMIEDPTEYLIKDRKSIITQRELGSDTLSFAQSLRAALRQDPDVILIGEMRDKETIEIALMAAETGHLVFSTLHTLDAQESINRILAAFEPHQQQQIRLQMASTLKAIVSQRLCMKADGTAMVPAMEVLINNSRIADMIADSSRTSGIRQAMEESQNVWGMCTFDQYLMAMIEQKLITYEEALKCSTNPENFAIRFSGVQQMDGKKWNEGTYFGRRLEQEWQEIAEMDVEITSGGKHVKKAVGETRAFLKKFRRR
jgi:twitching motility protein PilT